MLSYLRLAMVLALCFFAGGTFAQTALKITNHSNAQVINYSLQNLARMTQVELVTSNEFVDGKKQFEGPLARDLIENVGADENSSVPLTAANDYQVEFSAKEFYEYDVIFALKMDGKELSRREKGPIWTIYPMDSFTKLQDPVYNSRLIWQLVSVELR